MHSPGKTLECAKQQAAEPPYVAKSRVMAVLFPLFSTSTHSLSPGSPHTVCVHEFGSLPFFLIPSPPPSALPPTADSLLSVHWTPQSEMIWHLTDWLLPLSIMFSRSLHAAAKGNIFLLLIINDQVVFLRVNAPQLFDPLVC